MNRDTIKIVNNVKKEHWNEYLKYDINASIYHTPEWKKILEKSYKYKSMYKFAIDDSDNIVSMLPLLHIKSKILGNRLCCLPFSHKCGPLGSQKAKNILIEEIIKTISPSTNLEIRDTINKNIFHSNLLYVTHTIDLNKKIEEIWKNMDKSSVRWSINNSKLKKVNISKSHEKEDIEQFYELNCHTKKNKGVPCHPKKFLLNLFKYLNNNVTMYKATHNEEYISGGIMLNFNRNVIYGYGAALTNKLYLHPYHALIWKSIQDSHDNKFLTYDFGRTNINNKGLYKFKSKWGTQIHQLEYNTIYTSENNNHIYKISQLFLKNIPLGPYKIISNLVFKEGG